jgi:hypothetical protein
LIVLVITVLAVGGGEDGMSGARDDHAVPSPSASPPPSWEIHVSQFGQFALHHPPGWAVREEHRRDRSLLLSLTPKGGGRGMAIRRMYGKAPKRPVDVPNTRCTRVRVSAREALRCVDTIAGTVITTLTDTPQGNFWFSASIRSAAYRDYDRILATFQLLRGI